MSGKRILLWVVFLWVCVPIMAQTAPAVGARLVLPAKASGTAEIPLPFDLNHKAFAFLDKPPTCRACYDTDGITFVFALPLASPYEARGEKERDGNVFGDDRIEIYLKVDDGSPYRHYAVNSRGTLADEKMHDRSWNGTAEHTVRVEKDSWHVQIKVPYTDFGFDPATGTTLKAIAAAYCGQPANTYYRSSISVPIDFAGAAFETLTLSPTLPFAETVALGDVAYDLSGKGSLPVEYRVRNPDAQPFVLETGTQRMDLPGTSVRTMSDTIALGDAKLSKVTLAIKGILSIPVEVRNEIIPRIDLTALDWTTVVVTVANQKDLAPYVENVVVSFDGKEALGCPLGDLASRPISLKDLAPGPHEMICSFLNKEGNAFTRQTKTITVYEPERIPAAVSDLDVSRYYKPVSFDSGRVAVTRSRFDVSRGIFPQQIEVDSRGILDGPIHLVFDGNVLPTGGRVDVVSANRNQMVLRSVSESDGKTLTVSADHRYDGFVWYDVEISSDEPFAYGSLAVVMPLKLAEDILLSHGAPYPDATFRASPADPAILPTSSQTLPYGRLLKPGETADVALTSYVGLATDTDEEYRGLFFYSEGPKGWNVRNYDHTYAIRQSAPDRVSLTVNVSDGETRWQRKSVTFGFGLMPVPMRNDISNFHEDYRVDVQNWVTAYKPREGEKHSYLQQIAWNGVKIELAHESWAECESYWKAGLNETHMRSYVAAAKGAGVKTLFYFGFLISNLIPEFTIYHDLFLSKPSSYPDSPFRPYVYYAQGDPDQGAYNVCCNSVFGDFFARGIIEAVHHYDLNGIFFDGGLGQVGGCTNVKHGCGTVDPYGRLIPTIPIRTYRRLMEHVFSEGMKKDPAFIIDNHVAWPDPAMMGLLSAYWTGECSVFFDPQSRTDPGALRAMMNGKLYGIPCDLLRRPESTLDTAWAQGLLVDAYPRLIAMGEPQKIQTMWKLYDQYQLTSDTFTPYFSGKNRALKDNPSVLVSYYNTGRALLLVVSNYWSDDAQEVTLDLQAFNGLGTTCKDAWSDTEYDLVDNKVTMTIGSKVSRLIVIEKR